MMLSPKDLFSIVLISSATLVIVASHSVFSLLVLVLSFVNSAFLLLMLECEFLALIFIVVYVGAIAVLFLFAVMMLDAKLQNSFPFEPRGWDIGKLEGIGSTKTNTTSIIWLSDKGRQFFYGVVGIWDQQTMSSRNLIVKKETWENNIKKILQTIYFFKYYNTQTAKKYFLTFIIEDLRLEVLALLKLMKQNYLFLSIYAYGQVLYVYFLVGGDWPLCAITPNHSHAK